MSSDLKGFKLSAVKGLSVDSFSAYTHIELVLNDALSSVFSFGFSLRYKRYVSHDLCFSNMFTHNMINKPSK